MDFLYIVSPSLRKSFDKLLQNDDFSDLNFTDVIGGPFNKEDKYDFEGRTVVEKYDAFYWIKETRGEIRKRQPIKLIFYLRKDARLISALICIPIPDFVED